MRTSLALLALIGFASVQAAVDKDKVTSIPDCGPLQSPWYSGYLTVSPTKQLHYVYVGSLSPQSATDPVIVWFNGGPGCSSMEGLFAEHGPYVFDDGEDVIKPNPEPWNKRANLLYIESPAGVGFSYAQTDDDRQHNDMSSSEDAFAALQSFFKGFPELVKNDLYISGESYAGIYVPYLAWQLHQHNLQAQWSNGTQTQYTFKGIMVGNGATDWDLDISPAFPEVVFNFNLIPKELLDTFQTNDCHYYFNDLKVHDNSKLCNDTWDAINKLTGDLNWYDLFRKVYPGGPLLASSNVPADRIGYTTINGVEKTYKIGKTMQEYTPWAKHILKSNPGPVMQAGISGFLNRQDVRKALNIPDTMDVWELCGGVNYFYQLEGSVWIYPVLKAYGYKILIYSGDTDGAVPTLGTRRWIQAQNWSVTKAWRPWVTDQQTSGYIVEYDQFMFATVHGVGHMAPQWKRKDVTKLISAFVHGEDIN